VINQAVISTEQLLTTLEQLVSSPGSTSQLEELQGTADRVAQLMQEHGLSVQTIKTPGAPIVIGRLQGRKPFTLLLYHHYDVAPTGSWREWNHEPFQLAEREAMLYGRGVADGKGPLAAHLSAISALIAAEQELPCNIVILAEGEGLVGSPNLAEVIKNNSDLLKADACLAIGGETDKSGRPLCYSGVKGLLQVRLNVKGAKIPLPTGLSASVPNPLWRLLWGLGQLKSDLEEVLIAGFYDDVEGPSRSENAALRSVSLDEEGRRKSWGLDHFLFGMEHITLVRTEATMPTCNVNSITTEPIGEFNGLPISASARVDFQLVPHQRPEVIVELLRAHLDSKEMSDIEIEHLPGGYPASSSSFEHPFVKMLSSVGQHVYNSPLSLLPYGPFALPLYNITSTFNIPAAAVACARHDSAINAPNEHISLPDLVKLGQLLIELIEECALNTKLAEEA
jgi:acetylornithine deacetylase/succinyl-diaminopimelate desuccinylase-like protein